MLISDQIAELLDAMLSERDGILEIRRNEMAERLGCSPSQINYVIASRFSPERGYLTVSRRGGGGYIRIERKRFPDGRITLMHAVASVGSTLRAEDARRDRVPRGRARDGGRPLGRGMRRTGRQGRRPCAAFQTDADRALGLNRFLP